MNPMSVMSQEVFKQAVGKVEQFPSAIFCENDYMAISAIKTFQELDIKVPGQVAVMGFDNILEATVISPELTTIHVKKEVIAKTAMDISMRKISGQDEGHMQISVNTEVFERKSCRVPNINTEDNR